MCGICGFVGQGDIGDLERMMAELEHRGPDAAGAYQDKETAVYLGHRRLAVIDISGGVQPMWTADGSLGVVFNGEIYNHLELRKVLVERGHHFETDHSDTEVLLHGYKEWRARLPEKLDGMWAFGIYDRNRKKLFLSRDRFGKKPLFYTVQKGTFAFASELNALIKHTDVSSNVSKQSLKKYFAYGYIPAPSSLCENIYKLPGGHNLHLNVANLDFSVKKYWEFEIDPFEHIPPNPEEEWGAELRSLLDKAVKKRLMADVPLGVFLSGGIDSSSVSAFAVRHMDRAKLRTFSIGFKETSFDESLYARRVADLLGTNHHLDVMSMEYAKDFLPAIMTKLDEPMGDASLLPTYLLCQATRKHVTVAVGGDGGDELFAGYDPFRALRSARLYSKMVPRPMHRAIRMIIGRLPVSHRNMSFDFRLKRTLRGLTYQEELWNPIWLGPLEPNDLDMLFQERTDIEEVYEEAIHYWESCPQDNLVDKTLQFYTKLYLPDDILVKADRASMMHSLELRSPYLDCELVDFVRRIPSEYKFRHGQTKYILKKALEPLLPNHILYRPKKGFGAPIGRWFRDNFLRIDPHQFPNLFSTPFIHQVMDEHVADKADHRAVLWNMWVMQANAATLDQL
jgi:asparagine synthase (glutamine-hydrolysing)